MGFLDRFRGRSPDHQDADRASGSASESGRRGDEDADANAAAGSPGRLAEGLWHGVVPAGLPPSVDVHQPGPLFAVNAQDLSAVKGIERVQERVAERTTEHALRTFLTVVASVAADLKRRDVEVTELLLPEPASPWSALPFVPIVVRAPTAAGPHGGREVPVLVNPVPVTERELLAFFVFAGRVRRAPRFASAPVAVYAPSPLPAPFTRLADAELPGLLEGDLAPELATRTPTPAEGSRLFAESLARRAKLHLDGSLASLDSLDRTLGQFGGARYGNVARVALAAYVGEVASLHANARWEGKLPLAKLKFDDSSAEPLQMARAFLPPQGPPRIREFVDKLKARATGGSPS